MMLFINRNCYNSLQILGLYPSVFFFFKETASRTPSGITEFGQRTVESTQ